MKENFKKWMDGELDIVNQEVKPYPQKEEIEHLHVNQDSISKKMHRKIEVTISKTSKLIYVVLASLCLVAFMAFLMVCIAYLPEIGNPINDNFNYVAKSYIIRSLIDTHAVNAVTGMILDYRAFDTLGESFVLFSAITCVFILLGDFKSKENKHDVKFSIATDPIVKSVSGIVICVVFMFGVYVILNGHISPGGGFSGGALIGAALILYSLAFGEQKCQKLFNKKTFQVITSIALLGYCLTKSYSFFVGGMGIHTKDIFAIFPIGSILSGGFILILNICVGLVVSCTMYGFYRLFKKGEI